MAQSEKTPLRRSKWKKQILEIIRREGETSRTAVKRLSGLSMDSTLSLMDELLSEGLIKTVGKEEPQGAGRRATLVRLDPDGCCFIGLRFSAGGLSAVCTDFLHRVLKERDLDFAVAPDTDTVLSGICRTLEEMIGALGGRADRLRGIGIGAPGILDAETGVVKRYVHIPDWKNVPLKAILEQRFRVPVYVEHGVKCTARLLQEREGGGSDLMLVQMERGINLCAIANGRVVSGRDHLAGEIGHIRVEGGTRLCDCGHVGCLETEVSSTRLLSRVEAAMRENPGAYPLLRRMPGGDRLHLGSVCEAADAGDPDCRAVISAAADALGRTLTAALLLLNPEIVEVNGRLCRSALFQETFLASVRASCLTETLAGVRFRFTDASRKTDAAGAARLPFRADFAVPEEPASFDY